MKIKGTTSFQGRSRAGKGKLYYGLTPAKLASLKAAGETESVTAHATAMYDFTVMFVNHARDLAKSGQKDEARNWFRFFNNSKILHVLATFPHLKETDLQNLHESLAHLGLECHPQDEPSWQTDIEAIRFALAEILRRLPAKADATLGDSRLFYSVDGRKRTGQENFERAAQVTLASHTLLRSPARSPRGQGF